MNKRNFLVLSLAAVIGLGLFLASDLAGAGQAKSQGYVCPLTGTELPCPECCPMD